MAQEKKPIIEIEDLQPKDTLAGYRATWQERGLIAYAELVPIDDQPARGFILECGYNTASGREPGNRQIDTGTTLTSRVRSYMLEAMRGAGWEEIGREASGRPIWQHVSRIAAASPALQDQAAQKIRIDDLQPNKESYWAHWIEDDIQCSIILKALYSNDPARGFKMENWYIGRKSSSRPLSKEKQKIADNRAFWIRHRFMLALEDAGWSQIDDIWHFTGRRVAQVSRTATSAPALQVEQDQDQAGARYRQKTLLVPAREQVKSYRRTITASEVTYTCARCGDQVTKVLYPGAAPRYCDDCAKEVTREKTRARVARLRAGKRGGQAQTS